MPPSVPTALTTTTISGTEIQLAWNLSVDNVGVSGYRIYRNGKENSYSTTTSYADKNLTSGATYTYTVTALDAAGNESSQSSAVTARTTSTGIISHGHGRGRGHGKGAVMR
jgi:chitodextrinase